MQVLVNHEQYLDCVITTPSLPAPCYVTCVYAKCFKRERVSLWDGLKAIAVSDSPWERCMKDWIEFC